MLLITQRILPSWTPMFYWQFNPYAESHISTGPASPFLASGYDRTRARFLAQTPNFLDRILGIIRVTLQAQGCCVDRLNGKHMCRFFFSFSVLGRGSSSPLFNPKTDPNSEDWATWPPEGIKKGYGVDRWHINIIRKMYNHVIDNASFPDEASKERKIEEFWRTIIFNRTAEGDEPPPEWRSILSVIVGGLGNVPSDFISPTDSLSERAMAYVDPFMKSIKCLSRQIAHYIGLTDGGRLFLSRSPRSGDRVCVIFGCNTPLLIRPYKHATRETLFDRCTIVGPAYVQDYMYGKALEELDSGKLALQTFHIV